MPLAVTFSTLACVSRPPRTLPFGKRHATHGHAVDRRQTVVLRQPLIEHREVGRDQVARRQVVRAAVRRRTCCVSRDRRLDQQLVEVVVGIERGVGRRGGGLAQIEPVVEEGVHEPLRPGVVQQAIGLPPQDLGFRAGPRCAARRRARNSRGNTTVAPPSHRGRAVRVSPPGRRTPASRARPCSRRSWRWRSRCPSSTRSR